MGYLVEQSLKAGLGCLWGCKYVVCFWQRPLSKNVMAFAYHSNSSIALRKATRIRHALVTCQGYFNCRLFETRQIRWFCLIKTGHLALLRFSALYYLTDKRYLSLPYLKVSATTTATNGLFTSAAGKVSGIYCWQYSLVSLWQRMLRYLLFGPQRLHHLSKWISNWGEDRR